MNTENERKNILLKLGFYYSIDQQYHHPLLKGDPSFDFSASSVEGIIYTIFQGGYNIGQINLKKKFHELFKIEEEE